MIEEFDKLIEIVESLNDDIYKCKYFCTEENKKFMQSMCPVLQDDYFYVIPQRFVKDDMKDKIYVIPVEDKMSIKFVGGVIDEETINN